MGGQTEIDKDMRKFQRFFLYALAGVWLGSMGVSHAQQRDTTAYRELSGVEVTGHARRSVTREAAPLQVIDRAGIERLGVQELSEAVKRFSGVTVQDYGGIGGLKTVSVRSLGAKHTAVSYDGVTVTDAQSGQVDISRFSLDNVESVALSIGQGDDIFQTARVYASAGALSIQTAKPTFRSKPFNLYVKVKGGSFGLINPVLHYDQRIGKRWSASLHGDYQRADGRYPYTLVNGELTTREKRRNSDIHSYRLEGNLFGDLGPAGELTFKAYYFDSERGLPGSVNLYNKNTSERLWDYNFFTQAGYKRMLGKRLTFRALVKYNYAFTRYRDVNDKYAAGEQVDRNTQQEYYGSAGVHYEPLRHLSFALTTDLTRSKLRNNFVGGPNPKRTASQSVLAAQYKDSRLTATASLLGTYITDRVEEGEKPADKRKLSPAVSLSWRPFPESAFRVRASYKDIFRVPTFTDLYYLRMGNTGLKPEKTTQYDVGVTWSASAGEWLSRLDLSVDGYINRVEDKIVAMPTMYIWKMMNMGEVDIKGADVNLSARFPLLRKMGLTLAATYSYQYAVDVTNPEAKNYKDQIPYTPRHAGTVSLSWDNRWVNVSYLLNAVGDRYALPQNIEGNRIGSYVEQSLSANREFTVGRCHLRVQGELLNLADVSYDVIQYYPMPGRSWRLSLRFSY